jgi:hypothetical protein
MVELTEAVEAAHIIVKEPTGVLAQVQAVLFV